MKKDLKAFLCASVLVGAMTSGIVFADSLDVASTDTITTDLPSYDSITVQAGGNLTIGSDVTSSDTQNYGTILNANTFESSQFINNMGAQVKGSGNLSVVDGTNSGAITQALLEATGNFTNDTSGTINAGIENSGTFQNKGGVQALNVINSGDFTNSNKITAKVTNNETFINDKDGEIVGEIINNETYTNDGKIGNSNNINRVTNNGTFTNSATGDIKASTLENSANKTFTNEGTVTAISVKNNGKFTNSSEITANSVTNAGTFTNSGEITAEVTNGGIFENAKKIIGKVTNNKTFTNTSDGEVLGEVVNNDTYTNNGKIGSTTNKNKVTNNGTFTNSSTGEIVATTVENKSGKTFTNEGKITAEVTNGGIFENAKKIIGKVTNNKTFTNTSDGEFLGEVVNNDKYTNNGKIGSVDNKNKVTNNGTFTNSSTGEIVATTVENKSGKTFTNEGKITADSVTNAGTFTNSGEITAELTNGGIFENAKKIIGKITNNKTFTNTKDGEVLGEVVNNDKYTNNGKIGSTGNKNKVTNNGTFTNGSTGEIVATTVENKDNKTFTNEGSVTADEIANNQGGKIVNKKDITTSGLTNVAGARIENAGTLTIKNNMDNKGEIINSGTFAADNTLVNEGTFINSGAAATMSATSVTNTEKGVYGVQNGAVSELTSIENNGQIVVNTGSTLNVTAQTSALGGKVSSLGENNTLSVIGADIESVITLGNGNTKTSLTLSEGNIAEAASLNILQNAILNVGTQDKSATVLFNDNETDVWQGGVNLVNGEVNLDNYTANAIGSASYSQSGGVLNINNNSTLMSNSSLITGGDMNIDSTSAYLSASGALTLDNVTTSGLVGAMNHEWADFVVNDTLTVGDANRNQADFTVDVLGRSNLRKGIDHFVTDTLKAGVDGATINISDWGLAGDLFGWEAPIDRHISLDNVFKYNTLEGSVDFTSTDKTVFTPIGWYQLNNHGGLNGNYTLDLVKYNPQVFRGQVTTVAQWMNQLAIDDMLLNHSMLIPSFKELGDVANGGVASGMQNKYAGILPQFSPYQYSVKDGGLWYKMYGTFERLQMNNKLDVGNNAYGALIGADFGMRDLKNGWKFMPTAYIGYNGAHQTFHGVGAYQNGGQLGLMGTLFKDNFILGGLVYGGVYDNCLDVAGRHADTFNYFGGAATKMAYNWRFHRDWVLQPNLLAAYNFFGQQNWHSTYGQMGMMAGMLNGVNVAPGLNLIWEKDTFSIYATLQYMYNVNGAVGGRAGNVGLPLVHMERGYIQYGLGFTKRFTDRFSGYLQAVLRNAGRTGAGFQLGLNFKL